MGLWNSWSWGTPVPNYREFHQVRMSPSISSKLPPSAPLPDAIYPCRTVNLPHNAWAQMQLRSLYAARHDEDASCLDWLLPRAKWPKDSLAHFSRRSPFLAS
jgi:hypothetical protein